MKRSACFLLVASLSCACLFLTLFLKRLDWFFVTGAASAAAVAVASSPAATAAAIASAASVALAAAACEVSESAAVFSGQDALQKSATNTKLAPRGAQRSILGQNTPRLLVRIRLPAHPGAGAHCFAGVRRKWGPWRPPEPSKGLRGPPAKGGRNRPQAGHPGPCPPTTRGERLPRQALCTWFGAQPTRKGSSRALP